MSYTNLIYHIVFRTKASRRSITLESAPMLYKYIWGICRNKGFNLLRIGGIDDHIHILVCLPPHTSVADFVKLIKVESNKWLSSHRQEFPFFDGWGTGYCALTYNERDKEMIINYIKKQPEHHLGVGYADELRQLLEDNGINYNPDYFDKE